MTTLHDRLADLAEDAPDGGPVPGLWDRGRLLRRRQQIGTAVIVAAVVVLLAGLATVDQRRAAPVPVPADGPVGLPDRAWAPSPWLPSAARPGRLVAITTTDRGSWTGTRPGVVGISATSGDYAFLDLPDDWQRDIELSPDGRDVAYWLTGPTTDTANTMGGAPVTGVAVYETTTGEVTRHWIPTPHGLQPDFLSWADDSTLIYSAGQIIGGDDDSDMDRSSSRSGTVMTWSVGGEPTAVPGHPDGFTLTGAAHGRALLDHRLVDLADPSRTRRVELPESAPSVGGLHFVALGPSGQLAMIAGNRNPNKVVAGPAGELRQVPDTQNTWGVVDWLDDQTMVTFQRLGGWRATQSALVRRDLDTGDSEILTRVRSDGLFWRFATDLLGAPTYHADAPPRPLDPRKAWGGVAAIVVAGLGALVLWRRRVRP